MVHGIFTMKSSVVPVHAPARTASTGSTSNTSSTSGTGASSTTDTDTGAADFQAIFSGKTYPVTTDPSTTANTPPTAQSVFGANPWMTNPTAMGPDGPYALNPYYFATQQTANIVAQMVGGTVIQTNSFTPNGGGFQQQQPNYMIQMPDGGLINPGLVASFYTHGYSQSFINQMITNEVQNT
jgi:hypothetical protein